ncbi:MAG: hypothetical protein GY804_02495 [Alphaproteobacteria bacterium]|nr:hypothetical protein [Alphaproteobacteria bacterium]
MKTHNINARYDIRALASVAKWLEKKGVLLKNASNITQNALLLKFYDLEQEDKILDLTEAEKYLKENNFIQDSSNRISRLVESNDPFKKISQQLAKDLKEGVQE